MTRVQIIASALGATLLALGPAATADVTTTTTPIGTEGCHTVWADSETGAVLGWGDSPSQPCDTFTVIPDFTPVVIDTGDGIATTGRTEADACLADGSCVEVLPGGGLFTVTQADAIRSYLASASIAGSLDSWFWARVADCESGGRIDAPQHGRYRVSGLYQIALSTWRRYGGTEFAARASEASHADQITVARRIHDAEGFSPWGTCGRRAANHGG